MTSVAFGLFTLALLVPWVVLHELAHGYVSLRHGDPTAREAGRLSLNPLRHVDPFGACFRHTVDPLFARAAAATASRRLGISALHRPRALVQSPGIAVLYSAPDSMASARGARFRSASRTLSFGEVSP